MAIDISKLNLQELEELQRQIPEALDKIRSRDRKEAIDAIHALAREKGFELQDLLKAAQEERTDKRKGRTYPVRYRNPKNPKETWTGMGRRPKWAVQLHEEGQLEEARIAS